MGDAVFEVFGGGAAEAEGGVEALEVELGADAQGARAVVVPAAGHALAHEGEAEAGAARGRGDDDAADAGLGEGDGGREDAEIGGEGAGVVVGPEVVGVGIEVVDVVVGAGLLDDEDALAEREDLVELGDGEVGE